MAVINKLTKREVDRHIKGGPGGKLSDGGGLYLQVSKAGTPLWRIRYAYAGKARLYAVRQGATIADARVARDMVKTLLAQGRDPVQVR
nr:DUF4102 domain-containing protein [Gemmatimonadaceae bacterium]